LLVIEDAEGLTYADEFASKLFYGKEYLGIIITTRDQVDLRYASFTLDLGPIRTAAWLTVAKEILGAKDADLFAKFLDRMEIKQLPALAFPYLLGAWETWGPDAVREMVSPIDSAGLFGADGRPVGLKTKAPIITAASNVEKELIKAVHQNPLLIHELTPRKFEEFVAELMRQQGFSVELTPATRDGGKDIYLAAKSNLGSFLYLVECKHHKAKPVAIAPVQRLYGVLEGEKATAGLLVTTSTFTKPAEQFQEQVAYRLSLVDYLKLNKMISDIAFGTRLKGELAAPHKHSPLKTHHANPQWRHEPERPRHPPCDLLGIW
jgi:restriction system protein